TGNVPTHVPLSSGYLVSARSNYAIVWRLAVEGTKHGGASYPSALGLTGRLRDLWRCLAPVLACKLPPDAETALPSGSGVCGLLGGLARRRRLSALGIRRYPNLGYQPCAKRI